MANTLDMNIVCRKADRLFTMPGVCLRLRELLNTPNSSASEIAHLITTAPTLTARLLQIVSSPLYSAHKAIDSVAQAIPLIATKQLLELTLTTSVASMIRTARGGYLDMKAFWQHNVYCGLIANYLARQQRAGGSWLHHRPTRRHFVTHLGQLPESICTPVYYQHHPVTASAFCFQCGALHGATRLAANMVPEPGLAAPAPFCDSIEAQIRQLCNINNYPPGSTGTWQRNATHLFQLRQLQKRFIRHGKICIQGRTEHHNQ